MRANFDRNVFFYPTYCASYLVGCAWYVDLVAIKLTHPNHGTVDWFELSKIIQIQNLFQDSVLVVIFGAKLRNHVYERGNAIWKLSRFQFVFFSQESEISVSVSVLILRLRKEKPQSQSRNIY